MGDASVNTLGSPQVPDAIPHLHVNLTPQGSSDISLELTTRHPAAFSLPGAALLFSHAQWQYQDQLRKAQETLLPQADGQVSYSALKTHTCMFSSSQGNKPCDIPFAHETSGVQHKHMQY